MHDFGTLSDSRVEPQNPEAGMFSSVTNEASWISVLSLWQFCFYMRFSAFAPCAVVFSGPVWSAWEGFAKWTPACHTKNGTVQKEKDVSHSPDRRRRSELTLCLPFYLLVRPNYCLLRRHTGCLRYRREIASKDLCLQKCCAAHCRSRSDISDPFFSSLFIWWPCFQRCSKF